MLSTKCLENIVSEWVVNAQTGFIPGRQMPQNIVDIDTWCVEASLFNSDNALLLFDFVAAFPTISHSFLWSALQAVGMPINIIRAIQGLYANNHHWLKFRGAVYKSVHICSGVKQ